MGLVTWQQKMLVIRPWIPLFSISSGSFSHTRAQTVLALPTYLLKPCCVPCHCCLSPSVSSCAAGTRGRRVLPQRPLSSLAREVSRARRPEVPEGRLHLVWFLLMCSVYSACVCWAKVGMKV